MNKTENIKIVRRIGMPETNSSSSHSVSISAISDNLVCPGDKDWDIEITDGVLKIPGDKHFGWDYFKTNSVLTKLQYLCGIYCNDIRSSQGKKRISKLKKILKNIFGVKDVEFLWITEFSKNLKEVSDPDDAYYNYPEIDHNSSDIFEEITENINVIRSFLLSRDSWLYGGNDNSDPPEGFYKETTSISRVNAILSVELGGKIGRVDWEVKDFLDQIGKDLIRTTLISDDGYEILNGIYYSPSEKDWMLSSVSNDIIDLLQNNKILTVFSYYIYYDSSSQKPYVLFTNYDFNSTWMEIKKQKFGNIYDDALDKNIITKLTISKKKEGIDFVKFPIKIRLLEYDNYEI